MHLGIWQKGICRPTSAGSGSEGGEETTPQPQNGQPGGNSHVPPIGRTLGNVCLENPRDKARPRDAMAAAWTSWPATALLLRPRQGTGARHDLVSIGCGRGQHPIHRKRCQVRTSPVRSTGLPPNVPLYVTSTVGYGSAGLRMTVLELAPQ